MLVLVAVMLFVHFGARPESLGNMARRFSELVMGAPDMYLYGSDGNIAYELDRAKILETYYVCEKTDSYTLTTKYTDFVGDYKLVVYEIE